MLDVLSGGRLVAGFPVGTPMDTTYCYGAVAGDPAREIPRGRRPDPARLERARAVRVQRQVHPASLRQHLAAADAEAAPAGLGPGRRQRRDLGLCLDNDFLYAYLSYFGYQRPEDDGRVLGTRSIAHKLPRNPYRAGFLQFIAVADSDAEAERLYAEHGAVLLQPLPARLCRLRQPAGLHVDGDLAGRHRGPGRPHHQPRRRAGRDGDAVVEGSDRARLSRGGQPGDGRRPHQRHGGQAQRRPSHDAAALRQHVEGDHDVQHADVCREGHPAAAAALSANGRTAGFRAMSRSRMHRRSRRRRCS